LTHNFNFPILAPSKSEFLSIIYDTCKNVCKEYTTEGDCTGAGCTWDADKSKCRASQTVCEAAGCTYYEAVPGVINAYPCMLDICLTEVTGDNSVGPIDYAIFTREGGRGGCPGIPSLAFLALSNPEQ